MNTDQILANISKHIILSENEKEFIIKHLDIKILEKGEYLLKTDDPCNHIFFVNSGTMRAFFLGVNSRESTIMFAIQDWWITDMHCFLNHLPAMVNIQAVEKSCLIRLSKRNLDLIFEHVPAFNKFFRILMQNAYCREQLRMLENLSLPSAERYHNFINKYPQIASKVPLKQIASYLGITPEFLSAIRANKY